MKKQLIYFLLFSFLCTVSTVLHAQKRYDTRSKKAIAYYEKAIQAMNRMEYTEVLEHLDLALKRDEKFTDVFLLKAEVYRLLDEPEREAESYKKAIEINADYFPYVFYNLGVAYYKMGEYKMGIQELRYFIKQGKAKPVSLAKANKYIQQCEQAQQLKDNPVPFEPMSLGEQINDSLDQYWPSLSLDGKTMVYTVMLTDSLHKTFYGQFAHQEDFYQSTNSQGVWSKGLPLGSPINTPGNEGAQQISADGKVLVFTGCNRADGFGNCDIYFSLKTDEGWTKPFNIGPMVNSKFSEKQPCLSPDGRKLYFSSDRPDGIGGMDIWVSELSVDEQWMRPKNLGRIVNTAYDESSPFIFPDNKSLYFSSDGHPGLGLKDIFYSKLDETKQWTKPINIGYPINSHRDEIGLVLAKDGKTAYYASTIVNKNWNIFQFEMPENVRPNPVSYVSGRIFDQDNKQSLEANLQLLSLSNGDTIIQTRAQKKDGSYLVCLPFGTEYALNVSYPEYLFKSVHFSLLQSHAADNPLVLDMGLQKISVGNTIVLENIFFEKDSFNILPQSDVELKKIVEFIKFNANLSFEIGGHTDNSGDNAYNQKLSEKRAKAVFDYVANHLGVQDNISFKGYGDTQPVLPNTSAENRAKNRRTELKVLK
jgi:outer membrane protein OmpA-like peptidoglycan-associated protein